MAPIPSQLLETLFLLFHEGRNIFALLLCRLSFVINNRSGFLLLFFLFLSRQALHASVAKGLAGLAQIELKYCAFHVT